MELLDKFEEIEFRFQGLERKMSDPEIISDQKTYQDLVKQHADRVFCFLGHIKRP